MGEALKGFYILIPEERLRAVHEQPTDADKCDAVTSLEEDPRKLRPEWHPRKLVEIRRRACAEMRLAPEIP